MAMQEGPPREYPEDRDYRPSFVRGGKKITANLRARTGRGDSPQSTRAEPPQAARPAAELPPVPRGEAAEVDYWLSNYEVHRRHVTLEAPRDTWFRRRKLRAFLNIQAAASKLIPFATQRGIATGPLESLAAADWLAANNTHESALAVVKQMLAATQTPTARVKAATGPSAPALPRDDGATAAEVDAYSGLLVGNRVDDPTPPMTAAQIAKAIWGKDCTGDNGRAARQKAVEWMKRGKLPANIAERPKHHYIVSKNALETLGKIEGGALNA